MAVVRSTTDGLGALEVGATSKASRATPYNSLGTEVLNNLPFNGYFSLAINHVATGIGGAGACVWWVRNGSNAVMAFWALHVGLVFTGAATAASRQEYKWERYVGADPTTSTVIVPQRLDGRYTSTIDLASVFATSSVAVGAATIIRDEIDAFRTGQAISTTTQTATHRWQTPISSTNKDFPVILAPNEGLLLASVPAIVVGMGIVGHIYWEERLVGGTWPS